MPKEAVLPVFEPVKAKGCFKGSCSPDIKAKSLVLSVFVFFLFPQSTYHL